MIVSAAVFLLLLIPGNPAFVGSKALITFSAWIAMGLLLFAVSTALSKRGR